MVMINTNKALRINAALLIGYGLALIFIPAFMCSFYLKNPSAMGEHAQQIMKYCGVANVVLGIILWVIADGAKAWIQKCVLSIMGIMMLVNTWVAFEKRDWHNDSAWMQLLIMNGVMAAMNLMPGPECKVKFM